MKGHALRTRLSSEPIAPVKVHGQLRCCLQRRQSKNESIEPVGGRNVNKPLLLLSEDATLNIPIPAKTPAPNIDDPTLPPPDPLREPDELPVQPQRG
jgi:hypothetical protein